MDFTKTRQVLEAGISRGLHLGGQVYVSVDGQTLADFAVGENTPGEPLRTDMLMLWMSSGKPVTAVALAQLRERGLLDWDDPVVGYIPGFEAREKQGITLRHLLTHTGGIRWVKPGWEEQDWDGIITAISGTRVEPRWMPGENAGYHPRTSWYILAEVVRRVSGQDFNAYCRQHVLDPAGMVDTHFALTPEMEGNYQGRVGVMYDTEGQEPVVCSADSPSERQRVRPGSSARGPVRELGRFYEMLLNSGSIGGRAVLSPESVADLTARQRVGLKDQTFGAVVDWGLGFALDSKRYPDQQVPYGFGPHSSDSTFGHGGMQSSMGFCDPEKGLVAAWVVNGLAREPVHQERNQQINAAIYEDAGLAG